MALFDQFFKDIGIDLGTANSLIYVKRHGIAVNEPSIAAVNTKTNQILSVGDEAKRMMGRTPANINVIRPLVGGVISDFEMTQELLRQFLRRLSSGSMFGFRRGVLAIPDNLTEVERKSVEDVALNAGCAKAYLVESPVVAALGAGLPITLPVANLVVDIGGGTTDIAVISMGGTVVSRTSKVAGDRFNDDITRFVRDEFKLVIGEPTAELAKITVGSASPLDERLEMAIRGRDAGNGLPREVVIKSNHVRSAISRSLKTIIDDVRDVVEATPPELVGDMLKQGITICGGGALLKGIGELIGKETMVKVTIADDPLTCVARGLGLVVERFDEHRALIDNPLRPLSINL